MNTASFRLLILASFAAALQHPAFAAPKILNGIAPKTTRNIAAPNSQFPRFDPSGILKVGDDFLVVSDRKEYQDIYKLKTTSSNQLAAELSVKLTGLPNKVQPFDLEGIAFCDNTFYLVNEAQQSVIEVKPSGESVEHVLNFEPLHKQKKFTQATGTEGAGLEGIACDEKNKKLYVANERMFRMIYKIDLATWTPEDFFDVGGGWNLPRREGETYVYPDFADLYFSDGSLYALQRNDRSIIKIDPTTLNSVAVQPLLYSEQAIYASKEPFGMAEGLWMDGKTIYVLLDNNGMAQKKSGSTDAVLFEFRRPRGF